MLETHLKLPFLLVLSAFSGTAWADIVELGQIEVYGKKQAEQLAVEQKSRAQIEQELIRDSSDLVRYSVDVGISDGGRHNKGFAMRGVEANRVGINIDGVALPDMEENSLYGRYGNFNSARQSIDPELVRDIEIVKGADSFQAGSGALGGAVNYRTLNAQDLLLPGQRFGAMLKSGYGSRNREWTNTLGVGAHTGRFDMVLLYSQRRGHETESAVKGDDTYGSARGLPDPSKHRYHSYLAKFGFQIDEAQRIGASVNGQQGSRYTKEYSYALFGSQWRDADDKHRRFNGNLHYEWMPDSAWLALLRADADYQKTGLDAVNYKGTRNWNTQVPELDEIYDRRINSAYKRLSLRLDSQPLRWGGEHILSFKVFLSRRDFETVNYDTIGVGRSWQQQTVSTIQYPMKTTQTGFSLLDNITWNRVFSGRIGARYDHEKVAPKDLNAPCSTACLDEGKPAGNSFSNWNGLIGLNAQLNPTWQIGYTLSSGHRVPTASEMYFTFTNPYGTWQSNPDLKAERSITHTLSLQGKGAAGDLDVNIYQSRYRDFLVEQEQIIATPNPYYDQCAWYGCPQYDQTPKHQMVNLDKARISGIEFTGRLNLHRLLPVGEGWKLSGGLGYSKGKLSNETSLLSIQPLKAIIGLDYEQPEGRWGVFSRMTYRGEKKPGDAKVTEISGSRGNLVQNVVTYPWLNSSATVFDVYGYYKPLKTLTLRAGVYNLFDRKYHTWDSLRGINANSTTNSVDRAGKGLARFYAPGRNFALALEYKF